MKKSARLALYTLHALACVSAAVFSANLDAIACGGLTAMAISILGGVSLALLWKTSCFPSLSTGVAILLGASAFPVSMLIP